MSELSEVRATGDARPRSAPIRPRRSVLYMPGSNGRALAKARTLPADCVILDLEDSVAPDGKNAAREQVAETVAAGGFGSRDVVVRINAPETPWGREDLARLAGLNLDAILVPKVDSPNTVAEVERALGSARATDMVGVWAMIETPLGVLRADAIAACARHDGARLSGLVVGTNDLAKETHARLVPGRAPMLGWLSTVVLAARAHGIAAIDGVFNDLGDEAGFRAECQAGRDLGFEGKTLIHPGQIAAANEVFAPSAAELDDARAILAEFAKPENAGRGVVSLGGRMVERLHAEMAAETVAVADAIAARSAQQP